MNLLGICFRMGGRVHTGQGISNLGSGSEGGSGSFRLRLERVVDAMAGPSDLAV